MIAIGLTSGLQSIAYSVLAVEQDGADLLYWEVMPGPRKRRAVPPGRRYHAHRLMLSMIFERWPPAVIGLGPPSSDEEPMEWVAFMRTGLFEMGRFTGVPVVLFDTDDHLLTGLGEPELGRRNGLKTLIRRQLPTFSSNKKRVILATATAMAGATRVRNTLSREERAL